MHEISNLSDAAQEKLDVDFGELSAPAIVEHLQLVKSIEQVLFKEDRSENTFEKRVEAISEELSSLIEVLDEDMGDTFNEAKAYALKLAETLDTLEKVHVLLNGEPIPFSLEDNELIDHPQQ